MGVSGIPGVGGPSRGRADAAMTWGEETPGRTDAFEAHTLAEAHHLDESNVGLLGVGATAPEALYEDESAGLVDVEGSTGGAAWRRRLAPRHRGPVRSFFGGDGEDGR